MIDLRSDTVTQPTEAMRHAMANAPVGDDVYGEDPTINALEELAAKTFGKQAAIFVPTGSMGNQIALKLHTQPGQEVLCESRAHVLDWEMGMAAMFSGCALRTVQGDHGVLRWAAIEPMLSTAGLYYKPRTGLIWLENTHNMAGGTVTPIADMAEIVRNAHARNLPVHLDGARIFNAATALATDVGTLTAGVDTVNFCLSKGLCAPVGSLLVGTHEHIGKARSIRKALGGGMRQAGILAAAGIIALTDMPSRLQQDHTNAVTLAQLLAGKPNLQPDQPQTNILFITTQSDAPALVARMKLQGVLASAVGSNSIRLVTHRDVSADQCEQAAAIIANLAAA